eukprot:SAG22_NODE_17912_length_296_cov_1.055838_1_plen_25_part_10
MAVGALSHLAGQRSLAGLKHALEVS